MPIFTIRVVPNSSKTEVVGWMADGALKIKLAAPPVDGEANRELISFLAKTLKLSKSDVEITNGQTSKKKTIRLPLEQEALVKFLAVQLGIQEPAVQPKMF
ncbi:YggU family protein [Candidatus Uhrbacteria bacterium]|nr:YggU family protein [Candidatus Uhrbacteria bacterium]